MNFTRPKLQVPKSLQGLSKRLSRSNSSGSNHSVSVSPIISARPTQTTVDWAIIRPGIAVAWISPIPDDNRKSDIQGTLGGFLKPAAPCELWPLQGYQMTQHLDMDAAQTAALSRTSAAWMVDGLPYVPPTTSSHMTEEEQGLTERPWKDSQGNHEESPSGKKSLSIKGSDSIKGPDPKDSDGGSSHLEHRHPDRKPSFEKSPWEEPFVSPLSTGKSLSPAFDDDTYENSSDAWRD